MGSERAEQSLGGYFFDWVYGTFYGLERNNSFETF